LRCSISWRIKKYINNLFRLAGNKTTVRTEVIAGITTFLTMSYIIFVQPAILSGQMFGIETGLDFGAVMVATCLSAALATLIMAFYARYPFALAPGMGQNFFLVLTVLPAASAAGITNTWQVALGVIFISGVLFLILTLLGVREKILDAVSSNMRNAIAVGIGLFIAFIGLQNSGFIIENPGTAVTLNPDFNSPDILIFFSALLFTAVLYARGIRGSILLGILAATVLSIVLRYLLPHFPDTITASAIVTESMLLKDFVIAETVVSSPPSMSPTFLKMDITGAFVLSMIPFILIFLFMDIFDTMGTLIGVSERGGFIKDNKLPRAKHAMLADSVGTVAGAAFGTSTVTTYIESATGIEQGGRTGLTGVIVAILFLLALLFSPVIAMVASYPPITAPALVIVGSMMIQNVTRVEWGNYSESIPSFLIIIGIPLTYSIADGLAIGFISYPIIKYASGKGKEVKPLMYILAVILLAYFIFIRTGM